MNKDIGRKSACETDKQGYKKIPHTFDWTATPPPPNLTPFQQFVRDVDWTKSPLGPMEKWPALLRRMVCIIMVDPSPAVVYWGPARNTAIVYNEPYTHLIGQKHPSLMGSDPKHGFAEIWDQFEQLLLNAEQNGQAIIGDNQLLLLHRHSFTEEAYFSWRFIPIVSDEGCVVGSYATVVEVTREVINDRRFKTIQRLTQQITSAKSFSELWPRIISGLEENERDAPLVLLYSLLTTEGSTSSKATLSSHARTCSLEGSLGVVAGHVAAPLHLHLDEEKGFATAFRKSINGTPQILRGEDGTLPHELLTDITWRGFGIPSNVIVVTPIQSTLSNETLGFVVIGLNPRRPYDADYQSFIDLLIRQVATPHASALILGEEVKRRQAVAKQAAIDQAKLSAQLTARTRAFEESEARFAQFALRVPVGIAVFDVNGTVVYANEYWYKITRNPRNFAEIEGWSWMDAIHPDDRPQVERLWNRLMTDKQPVTLQVRLRNPSVPEALHIHPLIPVLCSVYVDLDENGNVAQIMGCLTDVSELKHIEDELRLRTKELEWSENQWKQFADMAPVGVCRFDAEGRLAFANDAWYRITEHPRDNKDPGSWLQTIYPEDRARVKALFDCDRRDHVGDSVEVRMNRAAGEVPRGAVGKAGSGQNPTTILVSAAAILNNDGTIRYIAGWLTDISSQKQAEDVLRTRMTEALETKRAQESFIDMTSHEMRNPISAVLHSAEEILQSLKEVSKSGRDQAVFEEMAEAAETIVYCSNHQKRIVDDILTLSRLDSKLLQICSVPTQPVTLVRNALKMFDAELKAAEIELEIREDRSLYTLKIDWLLLDPGRVLQVLINLITNSIKFTRSEAKRKITVHMSISKRRPSEEKTAIEYVQAEGTSRIGVSPDPEALYFSLAVEDTGKGLTMEEKKRLFNRFAQASPKTHTQYGGSGLGLFISRQLSQMQGGEIGLMSEAGKGSIFTFYVRTQQTGPPTEEDRTMMMRSQTARKVTEKIVDGQQMSFSESQEASARRFSHGLAAVPVSPSSVAVHQTLHILLAEDNIVNQKVVEKQLRKNNCIVDVANHGEEVLSFLRKTTYWKDAGKRAKQLHVVLMDCEMPVMDGVTTVRKIRELEATGQIQGHIPVIAVTANARDDQINAALEAGMDDVTTKPYRIADLLQQIQELIKRKTRFPFP